MINRISFKIALKSFFQVFIVLVIGAMSENVKAQQSDIDSLENIFNSATVDSIKLQLATELASKYQRSKPEKSIEFSNEALKFARKLDDYQAELTAFKTIAISYYKLGEYKKGIEYFQYRKNLAELNSDPQNIADSYNGIGILLKAQGKFDEALKVYTENEKLLLEIKDTVGLAKNYINKGNIFMQQDNYIPALNDFYEAMPLVEGQKDNRMLSSLYNNIGLIHRKQKNYPEALNFYKKALGLSTSENNLNGIYDANNNIGIVLKEQASVFEKKGADTLFVEQTLDSALIYFKNGLELAQQMEYKKGVGISLGNIGDFFSTKINSKNIAKNKNNLMNLDSAYYYYSRAKKIKEEINDKFGMAVLEISLGNYFREKTDYYKAIASYKNSYDLSVKLDALEIKQQSANGLSQVYDSIQNYKNAYKYLKESWDLQDSIMQKETIQESTKRQMQYDFDKIQKAKEMEQLQKDLESQNELKQQRIYTYVSIFGSLFMLFFLVFVLRSRKQMAQANAQLAEQKADIESKNNELEQKNTELELLSEEIEKQRDIALEQKKEITDSIQYAKRIQTAVLPLSSSVKDYISDYFIMLRPRDIVSGDYYWVRQVENRSVIIAADCTGHGVPGAFMSMLGVTFLNEIMSNSPQISAAELLNQMKTRVIKALHQTGKENEAKDGMDMAVCIVDNSIQKVHYAGAYNPLYLLRENEEGIIEYKADKMPIGIHIRKDNTFTNHVIEIQKGDQFYMFSDGYVDQFGGPNNRKFRSRQFKELLWEIRDFDMDEQKQMLESALNNWQGMRSQIDDILVIGFKI